VPVVLIQPYGLGDGLNYQRAGLATAVRVERIAHQLRSRALYMRRDTRDRPIFRQGRLCGKLEILPCQVFGLDVLISEIGGSPAARTCICPKVGLRYEGFVLAECSGIRQRLLSRAWVQNSTCGN